MIPEQGKRTVVWVARDPSAGSIPCAFAHEPDFGIFGMYADHASKGERWIELPRESPLDLKPGEKRAYYLVPVEEKK